MSMRHRVQLPIKKERHPWVPGTYTHVYPSAERINRCKEWCKIVIGSNNWNYYGVYRKVPCEFRFKREEDLVAFKLVFGLW